MTPTPWTRATYGAVVTVETAAHELQHALSARTYAPVIFMTIIPGPTYDGFTYVDHRRTLLSPNEAVHAGEIDRQASDIAILLVQITPALRELAAIEVDTTAVTEAAVTRLTPEHAAVVRAQLTKEHTTATSSDDAKTEQLAAVFGDEQARYLSTVRGLAWKQATADYPLLEALLPRFLAARAWTGDDLEDAIAAVQSAKEVPMTDIHQAAFDAANAERDRHQVAERAAEALSGAQLEVSRRQAEVEDRAAELAAADTDPRKIAAVAAFGSALWQSRLETAARVAGEQLIAARATLASIEKDPER
jgi:hypothetical protein